MLNQIISNMNNSINSNPTVFAYLVLLQGLFGGRGLLQTPEKLLDLFENPWVRFVALCAITTTATRDVSKSMVIVSVFLLAMHVLRTEDEIKEMEGSLF